MQRLGVEEAVGALCSGVAAGSDAGPLLTTLRGIIGGELLAGYSLQAHPHTSLAFRISQRLRTSLLASANSSDR